MFSSKPRGKWQWWHLIRGAFCKFWNQERFLFITTSVNFCLNIWIPSHDPVTNLPQVLLRPVANWPPVSKLVAKFAAGVVATGGKFAAGVVDTGGNLPLVSLIPVVHLDLRISPRIFPIGILWGWGETRNKNLVTLSFKRQRERFSLHLGYLLHVHCPYFLSFLLSNPEQSKSMY